MPTSTPVAQNFMLFDAVRLMIAFLVMSLIMVAPGYLIGWASNLFDFKQRRLVTRLLLAIVLSTAILPAVSFLIGRYLSLDVVVWGIILAGIGFLWLVWKEMRQTRRSGDRWLWAGAGLIGIWVIVAILSLIDLQIGSRLYSSLLAYDYQSRVALTDAIFRTGIPPLNPNTYTGEPLYVTYFYFWNILPALLSRLTRGWLDPRIAFGASAIWAGIALRAAACIYLRFHTSLREHHIGPRSVAAIGLFFITGLDIFPAAVTLLRSGFTYSMDHWNGNAVIYSWTSASLWAPHHVAGLVACVVGFLIMQSLTPGRSKRYAITAVCLAALSLASGAGMSLYVAFIFAIFWAVWLLISFVRRELRSKAPWMVSMGILALVLDFPYLYDLLFIRKAGATNTSSPLAFEVRPLWWAQGIFEQLGWGPALKNLGNLLLLPVNYSLELGFFLVAMLLYLQMVRTEKSPSPYLLPDSILLLASAGICTFFRSTIIGTNDLGGRGFMPAQFILLIWAVNLSIDLLPRWFAGLQLGAGLEISHLTRRLLLFILVMGGLSTAYDLLYLRWMYPVIEKVGYNYISQGIPSTWQYSERLYRLRQAYDFIHRAYPVQAVVQSDPENEILVFTQGLYSFRQTIVSGPGYGGIYGSTLEDDNRAAAPILPIFNDPSLTFAQVRDTCQRLNISALIVKDIDPAWGNPHSWVWQTVPALDTSYVRVYDCR